MAKPVMQFLLCAITIRCSLMIPACAPAQTVPTEGIVAQDTSEQAIAAVLTEQATAWNAGDLDRFMETYWKSDQLTFSGGGQTVRGWQATLNRYRVRYPTKEKMGQLRIDELEISPLNSDTTVAFVIGNWHLTMPDGPHHDGNFTLILKNMDGVWKIIHDHSSERNH